MGGGPIQLRWSRVCSSSIPSPRRPMEPRCPAPVAAPPRDRRATGEASPRRRPSPHQRRSPRSGRPRGSGQQGRAPPALMGPVDPHRDGAAAHHSDARCRHLTNHIALRKRRPVRVGPHDNQANSVSDITRAEGGQSAKIRNDGLFAFARCSAHQNGIHRPNRGGGSHRGALDVMLGVEIFGQPKVNPADPGTTGNSSLKDLRSCSSSREAR